jgi:hypothetical protein
MTTRLQKQSPGQKPQKAWAHDSFERLSLTAEPAPPNLAANLLFIQRMRSNTCLVPARLCKKMPTGGKTGDERHDV